MSVAVLTILLTACTYGDARLPAGAYTAADDLQDYDVPSGAIRVHYSADGPNAVDPTNDDGDGVPDRAEIAADATANALEFYEFLGFAPPATEVEMGFASAGGSDALDVYLTDILIEDYNLTFAIGKEDGTATTQFAVTGIPAAALIQDGVVVWRGHPARVTPEMIEKYLPVK